MIVRYANSTDHEWLCEHDYNIVDSKISSKIKNQEIVVAENENHNLGFLRFSYFWDSIPFLDMLLVVESKRLTGIGRKLVEFWFKEMEGRGYRRFMTSAMSHESAQFFHRKMGFVDCGSFVLPNENMEILFLKDI